LFLSVGAASLGALALAIKFGKPIDILFGNDDFLRFGPIPFGIASLLFFLYWTFKERVKQKKQF